MTDTELAKKIVVYNKKPQPEDDNLYEMTASKNVLTVTQDEESVKVSIVKGVPKMPDSKKDLSDIENLLSVIITEIAMDNM